MHNRDKKPNAFTLLEVSPQMSLTEIEDARESAGFDGRASDFDLQDAAHSLSAPVPRLQAEVSYLWGVPHDDMNDIINLAQTAPHWQKLRLATENFPMSALAIANMAAIFCRRESVGLLPDIEDALSALISAQKEMGVETVSEMIHQARRTSGFKPAKVDKALVADALEKLRKKHIAAAFNAIRGYVHPGNLATALAEKWRFNKKESGRFVAELIGGPYANWVLSILRPLEEDIDSASEKLRNNADDEQAVSIIETKLSEWDEYAQPLQLIDEKKGFDEQISQKVCGKLRALALHLHNEERATEISFRITRLLVKVFQELPEASETMAKDASALESILEKERLGEHQEKKVKNFRDAKEAMDNLDSESIAWEKSKFLVEAFKDLLQNSALASNEGLWMIVRGVAISMHNEHNLIAVARWLIEELISLATRYNAPKQIQQKLKEDKGQMSTMMASENLAGKDVKDISTYIIIFVIGVFIISLIISL